MMACLLLPSLPRRLVPYYDTGREFTPLCRIPAFGDLCVTRAVAPLNVILSRRRRIQRVNRRLRSFAGKGFGFLTPLRSVQNDSGPAKPREGVKTRGLSSFLRKRESKVVYSDGLDPCPRIGVRGRFRRGDEEVAPQLELRKGLLTGRRGCRRIYP